MPADTLTVRRPDLQLSHLRPVLEMDIFQLQWYLHSQVLQDSLPAKWEWPVYSSTRH